MHLNHPGRRGNALASRSWPLALSAITAGFPDAVRLRAMTQDEMQLTIASFAQAAATAREAGFDGVEINAAHSPSTAASHRHGHGRLRPLAVGRLRRRPRRMLRKPRRS